MVARLLWCLPFIFFLMGYYAIAWFVGTEMILVPELVGRSLQDVVVLLEPYKLNLRILGKAEDPTLPEGTIVSQHPTSGQKIKLYQSVGVVVSRKPPPLRAPDFVNCLTSEIGIKAEKDGVRIKMYPCESLYPSGRCSAQYPPPGQPVHNKMVVVYISSGQTPYRIVPDLRQRAFQEVHAFLDHYHLKTRTFHSDTSKEPGIVIEQSPPPYSFINLNRPPVIQLSGNVP